MSRRTVGFTEDQRRKDQRRDVNDTFIIVGGKTCQITDMSLRSFRCKGYKVDVKPGDDLVIDELLLEDNSRVRMNAPGMVIRYSAISKELIGVFVDISSANFDILERMMTLRPPNETGGRGR